MNLKFLLVKLAGGRFNVSEQEKLMLFLISPHEELTCRSLLKHWSDAATILDSGLFSLHDAEALARIGKSIAQVGTVVLTRQPIDSHLLAEMIYRAHISGARVVDLETFVLQKQPAVPANPEKLIRLLSQRGTHQSLGIRAYTRLKSVLEPLAALTLLVLFSPVLALVALLIRLTSPGPVVYSQVRVGHRSRKFTIYKFRSMRIDAESQGPVWALAEGKDQRLTPIGGLLRASHLDELPQLWNIFRGELSFIGPRPERPEFVAQLEQSIPFFKLRTLVRPGITGWAQIKQGYANSINDSLRKLEFDLFYVIKHSPRLDLSILFGTLWLVLTGGTEGVKRKRVFAAQSVPLLVVQRSAAEARGGGHTESIQESQ